MPSHADVARKARLALITRARRVGKPAKFDGDDDGFRTGTSGKDNVPYTAAAKKAVAKAAKKAAPAQPTRVRTREGARGIEGYRQRLRGLDDAGIEASLRVIDNGKAPFANPADRAAARRAVVAEMRRRDRAAAKEREQKARYEAALADGHDELTAWALATGQDPERLARKMERLARPSARQLRRDWELVVEAELQEAEQATRGQLVSAEGRLRYDRARRAHVSVDPRDFWRRNAAYVERWASEEFQRWAAQRGGITTFAAYRAMVEGQNVRDVRTRENRRLGEFG